MSLFWSSWTHHPEKVPLKWMPPKLLLCCITPKKRQCTLNVILIITKTKNDWFIWPNVIGPNGEMRGCNIKKKKKKVKRRLFHYVSLLKRVWTHENWLKRLALFLGSCVSTAGDASHYFHVNRRDPSWVAAYIYLSCRFFFLRYSCTSF